MFNLCCAEAGENLAWCDLITPIAAHAVTPHRSLSHPSDTQHRALLGMGTWAALRRVGMQWFMHPD